MSKQKNNKSSSGGGFVFSTNPDFRLRHDEPEQSLLPPEKQVLRIWLERIKGNKEATVIKGFIGPDEALDELAKALKNKCASGGNAKDGNIILQGDHREKVLQYLQNQGYTNVKKAGG